MPILKQEQQATIEKLTVGLEVSGHVLFKDTPIKNAIIELIVHGLNGETLLNLGKTLSGPTGHFYFKSDIPLSFRGRDIGVRICAYSTPSSFGKPFPIFFGAESFLFLPHQNAYDLGKIQLPLGWSFCERPLFFSGKIKEKNNADGISSKKIAQLQTPNGYVLAETPVSIDGSYHIYTYGDGRIPEYAKLVICICQKDKTLSATELFVEPFTHAYEQDIEI
ncbi:MAG: hypothetical protein WCX16_02645 [Candidatus Omnitrophota bacterium]